MCQRLIKLLNTHVFLTRENPIYLIPALLLSIALQLQVTVFKIEDYLGLRLNAADLLLPFLGIFILIRIFMKKDILPAWRISHAYLWLIALTTIITYALFNGYNTIGLWDVWAVINKYAGWFVLMGYFAVGGWIASRVSIEELALIFKSFIGCWALIMTTMTAHLMWIDVGGNTHTLLMNYPLSGFMGNRNAFAFISFSLLAIMTALQLRKDTKPNWIFYIIWSVVPLFYAYNASRAGLVVLLFIVVIFSALNFKFTLRHIAAPLVAGIAVTLLFFFSFNSYALQITHQNVGNSSRLIELGKLSPEEAKEKLDYVGDKVRMDTYSDALSLWKQYPLMGGGLGSFKDYQRDKRGEFSDIVDCTALWLLGETGIIGLVAFSVFFLMGLWALYQKARSDDDRTGIYLGIFLTMMIFAIMSLVHELMYTRFLWFFMGLGLALPLNAQPPKMHQDG